MTIPAEAYARPNPKPQRYMTDIDMPFDLPRRDAQRILERELQPFNRPAPGAEERIRQLQRMRQQQPRQVAPDPQPPPPPGPMRSVLLRGEMT